MKYCEASLENLESCGFVILEQRLDLSTVDELREQIEATWKERNTHELRKVAGIRNLLTLVPSVKRLAESDYLLPLVEKALGKSARLVRGVYFDKQKDANWKVAWHQDLTIAVKRRVDVKGFGAWSLKAGIQHVQPPISILEQMIALRLHLDDSDESNGSLRVFPGSHRHGRLTPRDIARWRAEEQSVATAVRRGDVMLMRPLLLHASSPALQPSHRRVIHLEYCVAELPGGLEWYEEP